jgi:hypothetical protein
MIQVSMETPATMTAFARAFGLPGGARFFKCALQVNPHHYAETYQGQAAPGDEAGYERRVVEKAAELGIDVLAITDHNCVDSTERFAEAARSEGIAVFPGFEVESREGVHVLGIFAAGTSRDFLNARLGALGVTPGRSSRPANKSLSEILAEIRQQGGLTIAAHATSDKGLLDALQNQARVTAWKDENLLAVQIPGAIEHVPTSLLQILKNQNADYRRDPSRGKDLALAVVNARDVNKPEDLADSSATTWIKMTEPSIEGLRQAFLDPESRIRLGSEKRLDDRTEILAVTWDSQAFFTDCTLRFNEGLNVLVGGRGAGKSAVIESLRYALDIEPLADDARKAHAGIVRDVIRAGTKISVLVRTHRPTMEKFIIERTVPNPPNVLTADGEISTLTPAQLIPARILGQHEISELTDKKEKLVALLEPFMPRDEHTRARRQEIIRALERSREQILQVRKDRALADEKLAELPGLEEMLKRYEGAGLAEKLKDRSLLLKEERVLDSAEERLGPFDRIASEMVREIPLDTSFLSDRALADLPGKGTLAKLGGVFERLGAETGESLTRLRAAIAAAREGIAQVRAEWQGRKVQVEADYEKLLRALQKDRVDGNEFIEVRRRIEALRPLRESQERLAARESAQAQERQNLLREWEELKRDAFDQIAKAAKLVSKRLKGRVRVTANAGADSVPLQDLLRENIDGKLEPTLSKLRGQKGLSPASLAKACREGKSSLQEFGVTPGVAEKIGQLGEALAMKIEELDLPTTVDIDFNVGTTDNPQWKAVEELSKGQKASAVLLILLLNPEDGTGTGVVGPLIVDQPEDDLDNRFVTEGIVPLLRQEKARRQFVFATHNANIPVIGDAEQIIGLEFTDKDGQGQIVVRPDRMGSLDSKPVRTLVEETLEGGKAAFQLRREKYDF